MSIVYQMQMILIPLSFLPCLPVARNEGGQKSGLITRTRITHIDMHMMDSDMSMNC